MNQSSTNQTQAHYAVVGLVGMDGSPQQGKFFGTCLVLDCPWATPYMDDELIADDLCTEHNMVFSTLPTGGVDWYGGRAVEPWEENYSPESQDNILHGPGTWA